MTVTGTISGNVIDPSGQPIASAKITLTSTRSGEARSTVTNEIGGFIFNAVQPETYVLRVQQNGFKNYSRNTLVVTANERVATGDIVLQIGDVTETISGTGGAGPGGEGRSRPPAGGSATQACHP